MPARELLPAECRARLFAHLGALAAYWRDLPEAQVLAGNPEGDVTEERLSGLLFSMLTAIDGSALSLPGFLLVPKVSPEDREAAIADGEEYWPSAAINLGVELHAAFPFQLIPPRGKP
ncbi:hypothetical protein GHL01_00485 [Sinorhizobium meliloti]|uniref:hypothetical protein n=1 Tax=Rhizobium meliloti TaxID=382 RepID=UPI0012949FE6|nr:hypothetical protein [Sinorhizobium meliloti]MQV12222.1 hypothetical protein [Sinorhizobium meliloti]